jgi:hypothetical protein
MRPNPPAKLLGASLGVLGVRSGPAQTLVEALGRLGTMAWEEAMTARLDGLERDLRDVLDGQIAHLAGTPAKVPRFLREVASAFRVTGENA